MIRQAISDLRRQVADLHSELVTYGLVAWTAGNVSGRVPGQDLFVIKPSGVSYDELTAEAMVVCDLGGSLVEGELARPPATPPARLRLPLDARGRWCRPHPLAVRNRLGCPRRTDPLRSDRDGRRIGGEIPVGPFALIGDDSIGKGIVSTLSEHRSPAVLMANHGVFTIGKDARAAVKAAVMCEDVARTVHLARSGGQLTSIDPGDIDHLYNRYQTVYGQH